MSARRKTSTMKKVESIENKNELTIWQKLIPPSVLSILTFLFYYPSLNYPFQFDDLANITKKFTIRFADPLANWLHHSRWIGDFLNRVNFSIGRFDPFYYRLFNVIIHIATGLLVFYLVLDLCKLIKNKPFFYNNSLIIAFTTAALFLLHPVQTQLVSYVIQARLEGVATLFILATIFTFVRAFNAKNIVLKIALFALSGLICFFSFGTKEIIVVTPLLLLLVDWFFVSKEDWSKFKKHFLWFVGISAVFSLLLTLYISPDFISRILSLKMVTGNNRGNILTGNAYDTITPLHFLISEFKVVLHYLTMFVWPFGISVEYDWKLSESFFAVDSFFPFLALMSLISIAVYFLVKKKKYSFFSFGLFWFLIAMAPRTTIMPSPELICDYKSYLASVGWLFVLATSLVFVIKLAIENFKQIPKYFYAPSHQIMLLAILMLPFGYGTFNRNKVWSKPSAFWGDIVEKAPLKARGHNNLGVALSEEGQIDESIECYKQAIKLDRHYADPLSNIAVAYSMKGEIDKAISALRGAINIFPNYPEAYNNLGTLLLKKQNYDDAEKALNFAIQLRPYYGKAFYNLGRLYMEKNEEEKAWAYFKKATEGDLDTPEGFFTLGQMSVKLQKFDQAIVAFEEITKRGLSNPQIQFNLANSYFMTNQHNKALVMYEKLTQENPLDPRYLYNYAETLHTMGQTEKALGLFQKTTTLPNTLPQSHFRIVACLEKLKKTDDAKQYLNDIINSQAPEQFKTTAQNELARLDLQDKLNTGNGSIKMSELQNALKNASSEGGPIKVNTPQSA